MRFGEGDISLISLHLVSNGIWHLVHPFIHVTSSQLHANLLLRPPKMRRGSMLLGALMIKISLKIGLSTH